jgi:hypothetical protein
VKDENNEEVKKCSNSVVITLSMATQHYGRIFLLLAVLLYAELLSYNFFETRIGVYAWITGKVEILKHNYVTPRRQVDFHNNDKMRLFHLVHTMRMVRNIDLPEAVIFYGTKTIIPSYVADETDEDAVRRFREQGRSDGGINDNDTRVIQARTGLTRFIQECHDIETAVIVLLDRDDDDDEDIGITQQHLQRSNNYILDAILTEKSSRPCHVFTQTMSPPDPTDLLDILNLIHIQPKPYGGGGTTIGYRRAADPERLLSPQRCVVFTTTIPQTRVARALGMRVVSFNMDDHLADAALTNASDHDDTEHVALSLSVDDIATPGSYWLNPPHPRDDNGNHVSDPYDIMKRTTQTTSNPNHFIMRSVNCDVDDEDSEDIRKILADISPLKL